MIEGWCLTEQTDVPIGADRRCLSDNTLTIPPSWSSHDAASPWPERPEGYVYKPPVVKPSTHTPAPLSAHRKPAAQAPTLSANGAPICAWCHEEFMPARAGGSEQRYCSTTHKYKAQNERRRTRFVRTENLAESHAVQQIRKRREETRTCAWSECGVTFTVEGARGSSHRKYHTDRCASKANTARQRERDQGRKQGAA